MRMAFTGKGGSGKTTLATLFTEWLAAHDHPVLAIDGDINQHLGAALEFTPEQLEAQPKLGVENGWLKAYLRGSNPLIQDVAHFTETTPAGRGSRFVYFGNEADAVMQKFSMKSKSGVTFMAIGGHTLENVAASCYHTYTGAEGILLNHLIDGAGEYVIGDMVAGADPFASSGLGSRFDVVFLVVEPTQKSLEVFNQVQAYLAPFGMQVWVVGNKIENDDDVAFIQATVGDRWVGGIGRSAYVRNAEKGRFASIMTLEPENQAVLRRMKQLVDDTQKDWDTFRSVGIQYHKIVADSWGEQWLGVDVMTQIDPAFKYQDIAAEKAAFEAAKRSGNDDKRMVA